MIYSIYDATGAFIHYMESSDDEFARLNTPPGGGYVLGDHHHSTHYEHNGEAALRPVSRVARTGMTLHNVPAGAKLYINDSVYDVAGNVELSFPLPGTYSLRVECFPYLDWSDEVTV